MSLGSLLARHVVQWPSARIPDAALEAARRGFCDTVALGIAGAREAGADVVLGLARSESGSLGSTTWAGGGQLSAVAATLVNSFRAGALDYDSLHPIGLVHPAVCSVPAALAVGEQVQASGADVLAAIAVADDLGCRLAMAHPGNRGWYLSALYGPMVAAAAAARLLRLSAEQAADALGLAFIASSGTQIAMAERSLSKRLQTAQAAAAGVRAALLAHAGYPGPREFLEGPFGIYVLYEPGDPASPVRDLGTHWHNTDIAFKLYPNCGCSHAVLDGLRELLADVEDPGIAVEQVQATISPYMERLVGAAFDPAGEPAVMAQFSLRYAVACMLDTGRFTLADLDTRRVRDPRIADLAAKVHVLVDDANKGGVVPATVRVVLAGGRTLTRTVERLRDAGPAELRAKFEECLLHAGYRADACAALYAQARAIAGHPDTSRFFGTWPQ